MTGAREVLAKRLRKQAASCAALGSPLYEHLLHRSADDVEAGGPALRILEGHAFLAPGLAIALRFMGAVHRLVLVGEAPELARFYPSVGGVMGDPDGAWGAFRSVLEERRAQIQRSLDHLVQTNEVGRSGALLGGFLEVARQTELPLRCLEIGASAGLNLRWDAFRYRFGSSAWGPEGSPVVLDVFDPAPELDQAAEVVTRAGCDPDPIDPNSKEGRLTLSSYVWADQTERWTRLQRAIEVAARVPATVDQASAGDWAEDRLADLPAGAATVLYHSIVWQYLQPEEQRQVVEALDEAGARATDHAPVAWLRMEPPGVAVAAVREGRQAPDFTKGAAPAEELAQVHLTLWPGGETRLVGRSGYHGYPVRWLG